METKKISVGYRFSKRDESKYFVDEEFVNENPDCWEIIKFLSENPFRAGLIAPASSTSERVDCRHACLQLTRFAVPGEESFRRPRRWCRSRTSRILPAVMECLAIRSSILHRDEARRCR